MHYNKKDEDRLREICPFQVFLCFEAKDEAMFLHFDFLLECVLVFEKRLHV